MFITKIFIPAVIAVFILFGCGKTDKPGTENKQDNQDVRVSGREVSVEIHTSGMTCTGCESTIKNKVKKINGVKDVTADFKTNTVKATYFDGTTNIDAIKEAITKAGYTVEDVKQ